MKPESAKRIIDAYFDVFDELSLKTFNQGFGFVLDSFEERLLSLRPIRTREAFIAKLLKEPEPEPFELDAQVDMIYLLPYTIRKVMPEAMHEAAKIFPQDPGGRPRALTDKESRYVCQEIGKLIAQGVSRLDAQDRLARRMSQKKGQDVGLRSVQRAWQNRKQWFDPGSENTKSLGERITEKLRGR
jgi:hypothetical protein